MGRIFEFISEPWTPYDKQPDQSLVPEFKDLLVDQYGIRDGATWDEYIAFDDQDLLKQFSKEGYIKLRTKTKASGYSMKVYVSAVEKSVVGVNASGDTLDDDTSRTIFVRENLGMYSSFEEALKKIPEDLPQENWVAFEKGRLISSRFEDANGNEIAFEDGEMEGTFIADYSIYLEFAPDAYEPSVEQMAKELKVETYDD